MKIVIGERYRLKSDGTDAKVIELCEHGVIYRYCGDSDENMYIRSRKQFIERFKPVDMISNLEPYTAYLEVDPADTLLIRVKGLDNLMGYIAHEGRCFIQSCGSQHDVTEVWEKHGMKVDTTPVEWRGGTYKISEKGYLTREDIYCGLIWNLRYKAPQTGCEDENIIRYKVTETPKIF
jgi:hypothetical protein